MEFREYLKFMMVKEASDLYLTTGAPPTAKIQGVMTPLEPAPMTPDRLREIAHSLMDDEKRAAFQKNPEMNLALSEAGVGRFRVNIFQQRNQLGMVIRAIKTDIPSWESLGLLPILTKLVMQKRGLVLFVGGTDPANPPRWPRSSISATAIARATSSPSKTRWSSCTAIKNPSSISARWASTRSVIPRR